MPSLWPLQQEAITPLRERWVHADPPGSGKTPVGLSWLRGHAANRSLIVAPSNVVNHWQRLASEWYPEAEVVVIAKGTPPARRTKAYDMFALTDGPEILVTTYALFREDEERLLRFHWDAVIFDEAHRLKNRASLLHKGAAKIARRAKYVELSTGSPIMGRADETWSYLHILYPKTYTSYWRWVRENFAVQTTTFGGRMQRAVDIVCDPLPGRLDAMRQEFGESLVVRPESVMLPGLMPPIVIDYALDMSKEERKLYDGIVQHGWTDYEGEVLIAYTTLSVYTRLRQMASDLAAAFAVTGGAGTKVRAVVELAQDIGAKMLIFASFKSTVSSIAEELQKVGISSAQFTGDNDADERDEALEQFTSGDVRVLVGTYGALAEGTDGLQHVAHHVVLVDHDWTPEIERQAIRRLHRSGQELRVVIHNFSFADTIDQIIADVHARKNELAEYLLGKEGNLEVDVELDT